MTPILLEELGMGFPTEKSKQRVRYGLYQCQYCGKEFRTAMSHVRYGNTRSCGCISISGGASIVHGLSGHPLYKVFMGVKARCTHSENPRYEAYGGRGISICNEWNDDFLTFYTWAINNGYTKGLSLDRIDVDGNYEPDNCRFTTPLIQSQNIRPIKKANKSGYKGVSWNKQHNKYEVRIRYLGKKLHLGLFEDPLEGAKAYQRFVLENNTEHSYVPVLTEEEIEEINKQKKDVK